MQLPQNFDDWKYCIQVSCGIKLTGDFIEQRLAALNDISNKHTKEFIQLYGKDYQEQVISWFKIAHIHL